MEKKDVKKAFSDAEKELKDKQIQQVKELVKRTLTKLDEKQKVKRELDEEIRILKLDIEDLKSGRLDRIQERQEKDEKAKKTSVAEIIKIVEYHHHYDYWYQPWRIIWNEPVLPYQPMITYSDSGSNDLDFVTTGENMLSINCSIAKDYSAGTYQIDDKIVHLR